MGKAGIAISKSAAMKKADWDVPDDAVGVVVFTITRDAKRGLKAYSYQTLHFEVIDELNLVNAVRKSFRKG